MPRGLREEEGTEEEETEEEEEEEAESAAGAGAAEGYERGLIPRGPQTAGDVRREARTASTPSFGGRGWHVKRRTFKSGRRFLREKNNKKEERY